jgi:predicted branched-subunit amino acid permease
MLPIIAGVIPFGLVMGTVAANAKLSLFQTMTMNTVVFAGASQLAAVDLMTKGLPAFVVVLTGLIINLRFFLYSAAISVDLKHSNLKAKLLGSYLLTDQSYSVTVAHEDRFINSKEKVAFYFGASVLMTLVWQAAVFLGHVFGNFAPSSWALDFAVPLSFVALVLPTLKNKNYYYVGLLSAFLSLILKDFPFNLGLLISALVSISFAAILLNKERSKND